MLSDDEYVDMLANQYRKDWMSLEDVLTDAYETGFIAGQHSVYSQMKEPEPAMETEPIYDPFKGR